MSRPDFLMIAFEEYVRAMLINKHHDSDYVKTMSYHRYEEELRRMACQIR